MALAISSPVQAELTYSGRAYAAYVSAPTLGAGPLYISDAGELSASGGFRSASLLSAQVTGIVMADVLIASTSGANSVAKSSAALANIVILPGHPAQVTAAFVRAEAEASCAGVRGSSELVSVTFGGLTVLVTGQPNQTIVIPNVATLIINEQRSSMEKGSAEMTVNALHLKLFTGEEVILSSAHSDVKGCPAGTGPCHDFVTGGGWIEVNQSRANFGFNAGVKPNALLAEVHLNFVDHSRGMKVKAVNITRYEVGPTPTSRHFEGSAEINGVPGHTYSVDVTDNAEPGRLTDMFSIRLSNGYEAAGRLQGGNIQLHASCQ